MEGHEHVQQRRADGSKAGRVRRPGDASTAAGARDLLSLQRLAGNSAVAGAVASSDAGPVPALALSVQREPHGDPSATPASVAAEAGVTTAPPPQHPTARPTRPASRVLDLATSQRILTASFGTVHTIVPGSIHIEPDQASLFAEYDRVCIANNVTNPMTRRAWVTGDAQRNDPSMDGFQWGNDVYIDGSRAGSVVTPHEMLHLNTASDWRAFVGDRINEGMTECLAIEAMTAAGTAVNGTGYNDERTVASALIATAGRDVVIRAYFNGGADLTAMSAAVDRLGGAGTWTAARTAAEAHHWSQAVTLLQRRAPAGGGGTH